MPPLPVPSPEAAAHSARLAELIRSEIAAHYDEAAGGGWMSFARYMELALYAPGLGYYTAGAQKFGEAGDFITAPELSPLFGRAVAHQVAGVIAQDAPHVMELGAGSGKLAADMLAELERIGSLPESYSILEVSADLRERQKTLLDERLPHLAGRVRWLDELPGTFAGAVVANEVLDALPVHLVYWAENGPVERGVAVNDTGFCWQDRPIADPELLQAARNIAVPDGYVSEICLAQRGLINSLAQRLERGALLFVDYGFGAGEFFHPQRHTGTLMCHYRHRAHDDPFFLPGLQDITAHVNFTDVAECGIDAGLELLGYTTQAFFLLNCGIADFIAESDPEKLRNHLPLSAQLQKLTSPAEMGELFKAIMLGKGLSLQPAEGWADPLRGFAQGDLSRLL